MLSSSKLYSKIEVVLLRYNLSILGQRIREERHKNNLTIEQLAESLDISASFLGLVERGVKGISIDNLATIAELFDIPIDSLLQSLENLDESTKYNTIKNLVCNLNSNEFDFIIKFLKDFKELSIKNQK